MEDCHGHVHGAMANDGDIFRHSVFLPLSCGKACGKPAGDTCALQQSTRLELPESGRWSRRKLQGYHHTQIAPLVPEQTGQRG